ncbi:hypothetical protein AVEN_1908-1 [Araneus ventricosus]|uniref:Uncharacterized protein n=1 Tax=Araneus ventricosus TaxID=182803 RepID=A0A4Y2J2A1_ARAVE|nr:hypothetical protein AVEN_1908-1 [Araneus ventricosus]
MASRTRYQYQTFGDLEIDDGSFLSGSWSSALVACIGAACPQNAHDTALADSHLSRETTDPFIGLLAIAASTCLDLHSSVAVFGLPNLLASATEPALLNLLISFATVSWII